MCLWGLDAYEGWCVVGAVKEYMTDAGSVAPAWALCALGGEGIRSQCYEAVGEYLLVLEEDPVKRWAACQGAPSPFDDACRRAARV